MTLLDLAARCESATEAEQRELLITAWRKLYGDEYTHTTATRFCRFCTMLDAGAYESAALMLMPQGWAWTTATYWCDGEDAPPYYADCADLVALNAGQDAPVLQGKAVTPALALCAAALRARAQTQGDEA